MDHPVVDNPDIRSKFYNSIRPILKEQKDCIVLLNDKHANNRTSGSKLWHTAKTNERVKFPSGSVSQRVHRAKEEFKRISTRAIKCDPTFLRMLNVKEIDILIGETKNIAGTCSSIRNDLYKISSGKKEHIYAEATSPDVEKNVGSFRLTKRVASSKRLPPINKLDDDANFDSSAKIPEMTSGALMQFLVHSCGLRSADAKHHITATFLNDNRKPNQCTSKIASESAATKSSSTNVNSIDKCLEPKAKRARPRPASSKEVCPESEPPSPNTIASGRSTPAHARDRVFEDLDDLDGADTINNLLTSLGETSAFSKRHEPRPNNRDEAIPDISDDFEFFSNTIDNLDVGLKPSDYFPN
jgi:hypothetical protein